MNWKEFLKPSLSKILFFIFGVWISIIYFVCAFIHALIYGLLAFFYPMKTCVSLILWPILLLQLPGPSSLIIGLTIIGIGFYWYVLTCLFDRVIYEKIKKKFKKVKKK